APGRRAEGNDGHGRALTQWSNQLSRSSDPDVALVADRRAGRSLTMRSYARLLFASFFFSPSQSLPPQSRAFRPAATTPAMRKPWPTRARGSLSNATAPAPQPVADTRVQIAQLPIPTLPIPLGWKDSQNPQGTCANGSTYDDGELLVSQIGLHAEPPTAARSPGP